MISPGLQCVLCAFITLLLTVLLPGLQCVLRMLITLLPTVLVVQNLFATGRLNKPGGKCHSQHAAVQKGMRADS